MIDRTIEQLMDLHAENWWLKGEVIGLQVMCNLLRTQMQLQGERLVEAERREGKK